MFKNKYLFLVTTTLIITLFSCSNLKNIKKENNLDSKEKMAFRLCAIYAGDQIIRNEKAPRNRDRIKIMQRIDTLNFNKLIDFIVKNGYPNEKLLGSFYKNECVQGAAGVVLLHNPHRLVNEEKYFNFFLNEVKAGNMKKEAFALVIDKYYWIKSHGKSVLYGSQFGKPCIASKEKTNLLRKQIGLRELEDFEFKDCKTE